LILAADALCPLPQGIVMLQSYVPKLGGVQGREQTPLYLALASFESSLILGKIGIQTLKRMSDQSPFSPHILIGQLDKVLDNFGEPVRILIHQAVA